MRSSHSSQLVWTLLVFMTVAFFLPAEHPSAMAEAGAPPPRVIVARPIAKTIDVWDEYTGRFEALKQVEVRARVSGTLDKINFADGQLVKEGDLLFIIDSRPYQNAVDSAKADVTKAQAQVTLAATDAVRAQQLAESRTITTREVDQRKANLDVAKAQQLAAEAALRNAELNLEWTQVRAPIPGRVSDRRVDAGNLIEGGQTGATLLTTIVTLDPIHFVLMRRRRITSTTRTSLRKGSGDRRGTSRIPSRSVLPTRPNGNMRALWTSSTISSTPAQALFAAALFSTTKICFFCPAHLAICACSAAP